jgi:hypothetical protein
MKGNRRQADKYTLCIAILSSTDTGHAIIGSTSELEFAYLVCALAAPNPHTESDWW